jgi:hypothetical protein
VTLSRKDCADRMTWQGVLLSVQPRIRLTRSLDQRSHTYLGYTLNVRGRLGSEAREFLVGVGQGRMPNTNSRQGLLSPALRCRFRIRGLGRSNSTRSAN